MFAFFNRPSGTPESALDLIFGLRAWGLILYGALPANLALLGTLEVKLGKVDDLKYFLIPVSLLPVFATFLLIRNRYKDWYLTTDFLKTRSAITTLVIVVCASLISGASGILHNKYVVTLHFWNRAGLIGIAEAYLFGISSLVITSTLFMTVLSKGSDLPGLPSSKFVELLAKIRSGLRQVQASPVWDWSKYQGNDRVTNDLKEKLTAVKTSYEELKSYPGNTLAKKSLILMSQNLLVLEKVVDEVDVGMGRGLKEDWWKVSFAPQALLSPDLLVDRNRLISNYDALQALLSLRLGD
jgi:hypothetical protein